MSVGFTASPADRQRWVQQRAARRIAELKAAHGSCKTCGNVKTVENTAWFEGRMYCRVCVESGAITLMSLRWVYFIADGAGHVKIGYAENVGARLTELQTGNAHPLTVLATVRGSCGLERALHARFADHRIRGEWFRLVPEIMEYIDQIRALEPNPGCPPRSYGRRP
jgi:hypothetical protein